MPPRNRRSRRPETSLSWTRLAFWVVALVVVIVAIFLYNQRDQTVVEIVETITEEAQQVVRPEPPVAEPPPEPRSAPDPGPVASELPDVPVAPDPPLPALNESDSEVVDALSGLDRSTEWLSWLQPEEMVRKVAVIVDSAARGEVARKDLALPSPERAFPAQQQGETVLLDRSGYQRYDAYLDVLNTIDTDALALVYRYYQPLFEEAYAELGYADRTFDSSLREALDLVLQTPRISGDIELTGQSVAYEFADPELEALPPLTKQIIRMGPRNSAILIGKAEELKASLSDQAE